MVIHPHLWSSPHPHPGSRIPACRASSSFPRTRLHACTCECTKDECGGEGACATMCGIREIWLVLVRASTCTRTRKRRGPGSGPLLQCSHRSRTDVAPGQAVSLASVHPPRVAALHKVAGRLREVAGVVVEVVVALRASGRVSERDY